MSDLMFAGQPEIENSDQDLRDICYEKAHEWYGKELPEIVEARLERELNAITSNGYSAIYIVAQKLVGQSIEDGYIVGSRGSTGSSFVATMAGITEVNPLSPHYRCETCFYSEFDTPQVREFAGGCGWDMPDKVCPKCGAPLLKDGFDIPFEAYFGIKGDKELFMHLNFSGEYLDKAYQYMEVLLGEGNVVRNHVLQPNTPNLQTLLITGHDHPTIIKMLEDYVEDLTGNKFDAAKIPLDDEGVMRLLTDSSESPFRCLGIPEFGMDFVRRVVVDGKPKSLSDLIRILALSHGSDVWLGNAQTLIQEGIATISNVIGTRDEIMMFLINKGMERELSFTIMESVRLGKGLRPEWEDAMREVGVREWYIDSCKKIKYLFPKAHAAAYVMMAYRIAYCKVHYPVAFAYVYSSVRPNIFL